MLGGDILVGSDLGKGSTFSFDLWLEKSQEIAKLSREKISNIDCEGKVALVVDDVDINRIIVREQLAKTKMRIEEALDGQEAVEKIKSSPENYYDIVFMDVQMPRMNGYVASENIRRLDRKDVADMPIVAMTANAFKEDIEKALAAGMDEHLPKPLDPDKLNEVVYNFVVKKGN